MIDTSKMWVPYEKEARGKFLSLNEEYADRVDVYLEFKDKDTYQSFLNDWKLALNNLVKQQKLLKKLAIPQGYSVADKEWVMIRRNAEVITYLIVIRRRAKMKASELFKQEVLVK